MLSLNLQITGPRPGLEHQQIQILVIGLIRTLLKPTIYPGLSWYFWELPFSALNKGQEKPCYPTRGMHTNHYTSDAVMVTVKASLTVQFIIIFEYVEIQSCEESFS
jgi:hypothetical protein